MAAIAEPHMMMVVVVLMVMETSGCSETTFRTVSQP